MEKDRLNTGSDGLFLHSNKSEGTSKPFSKKDMSNKTIVTVFVGLGLFLTNLACIDGSKAEEQGLNDDFRKDLKVIAYYTRSTGEIDDKKVQQLDEIIYSFLHLNGNRLDASDKEDSASIAYLTSLKAQNPKLKILVSLGGWGGCETCSAVFSSKEGRKEFAESVKDILVKHEADGIDLDWEYPAIKGYPGHAYKPEDRENFTSLVKELRKSLGQEYIISFAAGGSDEFLINSIEWGKVMPFLDGVNLMTYDLVGGGSPRTGHHTALYSTKDQKSSARNAIQYLDSIGIPREKMVIGAAFYARVWEGVEQTKNGLYQPGKFKEFILFKNLDDYFQQEGGFVVYWDEEAQAAFSYNPHKQVFATYDDSLSVAKKTRFAIDEGLRGIMFWQLSGDKKENGLIDVIHRVKDAQHSEKK